ncbi:MULTISPECIES: integrase [Catenuloplanes]|uniref:Uncharacterized protein n=1 Tax=Catenuloplanes niger TaxID=587534 RepID=A0AAE3ZXK7_9ACTN|nr:integrase [Catenuloplanes niger]MDR7327873.1 hypothetical protein [Catenuloplanes niger]
MTRIRLRHLHADGHAFTWRAAITHVRGTSDCHRAVLVRVWGPAGKTGCVLRADLISTAGPSPWGYCATDGSYPTSGHVRALIDHALAHGWDPARRGGEFTLSERAHPALVLDGFLLTDRLWDPDAADPTPRVIAVRGGHGR